MADKDVALVQHHIDRLREHFDTVQIFVTREEPEKTKETITVQKGSGNWFARYGQVRLWMLREEEPPTDPA